MPTQPSKRTRLASHVDTLFEAVQQLATPEGLYEGNLTDLYKTLDIPLGQYSHVRRVLFDTGCLTIIRRGSRAEPSLIQVNRPPEPEDLTLGSEAGRLSLSAEEMSERLERLEVWRAGFQDMNIIAVLINQEKRISKLEAKLKERDGEAA